jgi:uncharacterized protein (DUF1330 family)
MSMAAKGYWIAQVDISDPEGYKAYQAEIQTSLRKYGGRFRIRGGKSEVVEGQGRSRAVVIEFPDYDAALQCYRSLEYAKAKALRQGKATADITVVEGYDGPQAADQ